VTAQVSSQQNTNPWAKAGVMLRATTDPGSPYYAAFATPGNGIAVQWRSAQGGSSNQVLTPGTVPLYLRVARFTTTGTTPQTYFTAYTSPDGINWTAVPASTQVLSLPQPLLGGFAITSHEQGTGGAVTLNSVSVSAGEVAPPGLCPSSWSCTDIGGPLPAGEDSLSGSGTWSEVAGGADIWGTADSFHFVAQPLTGDGTVAAQVTSQQNTSAWAKAGVMLRATTDPGSPYYAAFATPGSGIAVQWRASQGGSSGQVLTAGSAPVYLMIARYTTTGSTPQTYFTAYTSPDGVNWTIVPGSTQALSLPQPLLGGFALTSHNQGTGGAVTLNAVSVTPGEYPGPNLACPSAWNCADIGSVTPAGGQAVSGATWNVLGGGPDIWSTADTFHYVWQSLPGDGAVSAQVNTPNAADPFAKSGVMIRASTDPGAPFYAAYLTPGNGILVQARNAQATPAFQVQSVAAGGPAYLEVTRTGTSFTAYTSPDGTTWTPVAGSTVTISNLTGAALAGLAVCSHSATALSTTTFNAVTVG
jgi:hypothetical protein